jgi:hypothetical protein
MAAQEIQGVSWMNAPDTRAAARAHAALYDELFRRVPHHPQLLARGAWLAEERARTVKHQWRMVSGFLAPGCAFMEIGAGDCALSAVP